MACNNSVPLYGYPSTVAWDTSYSLPDDPLTGDFFFTFEGKQGSLGVVVGVTPGDVLANYIDIQYGIYFRQNRFLIVENGAPQTAWMANDGRWEYTISRFESTVYYTRRDVLVVPEIIFDDRAPGIPILGELLHVSAVPSFGPVYMDSSYYAVGDGACFLAWGSDAFVAPEFADLVGVSGAVTGLLPLTLRAGAGGVTAMLSGVLPIDGSASSTSGASEGVYNGELRLAGWGSDTAFATYMQGFLAFDGSGVGTVSTVQTNEARVVGYLPLSGGGYTDEAYGAGVYAGQFPLEGAAAGHAGLDPAIQAVADWEMPLDMVASGSAQYTNYFQIVLPELFGLDNTAVEITDEIRASMALDAQYAIMVRDFIRVATSQRTFARSFAELMEVVSAVTTAVPDFVLWVQETLSIDDTVTLTQVVEMADTLVAEGMVQSFYQGVVAVLSAITSSDNRITGGSAVGSTAGVGVISFGPPTVEFVFTGYWKKGTEIQLGYTTDVGPGYISYTLEFAQDALNAMALFAAALDAQPLVNATFDGTSVTITAQAPATTVSI